MTRAIAVTPIVEVGKILLPVSAGRLEDSTGELSNFRAAPHDWVDSTTQALQYLLTTGIPGIYVL